MTDTIDRKALGLFIAANGEREKRKSMQYRLASTVRQINRIAEDLKEFGEREYTGWYALFKKTGGKWECIGCINPDDSDLSDDDPRLEQSHCIMPIPKPEELPEWNGF